jgi:Chemoreceptor zinc-binding domain
MIHSKEIVHAIGAHGNWKQRLRRAIETGNSDFTIDKIKVDNHCEFGNWLHSLSSDEMKSSHWTRIQQLHAKFHFEAARLFELATQGKQTEALDAMGLGTDFAKYSSELTMAMVQWKRSLTHTGNIHRYVDTPVSLLVLPKVHKNELLPDAFNIRDDSQRDSFRGADPDFVGAGGMSISTN